MRWTELPFLPVLPPQSNGLTLFGLLLLAGLLGGEVSKRLLRLPRMFGYVLAGVAIGTSGLGLVSASLLQDARVFIDVAVGLIVFDLGRRVDLRWLLRERWLLTAGVAESVLAFGCVYLAMRGFGMDRVWSAVAAGIGIATSAPVVMVVVDDLRAEGQITDRVLLQTWVNTAIASVVVAVLTSAVHFEHGAGPFRVALHPLYLVVGAALVAVVGSLGLLRAAKWLGKREDLQFILLVGVVVLAVGASRMLKLPVLLVLLALGALARNLDRERWLRHVELGVAARLFVVVLFVATGASLDLKGVPHAALPALAYIAARLLGKGLGTLVPSWKGGVPPSKGLLVTVALQPLSTTAVVLALDTAALYPQDATALTAVVLTAVALLELAGPLAVQFALKRANETQPETASG
jgi:Kef-type K+ transport system membrane component KefB